MRMLLVPRDSGYNFRVSQGMWRECMQVEGGEVYPRTPLDATTAQCIGISATRHKFETVLRQQVLAKCPGIELTTGGTVKGLLLSDNRTAVTGKGLT